MSNKKTETQSLTTTPTAKSVAVRGADLGMVSAEDFGTEFSTAKGYTTEATVSLKYGEAIKGILLGEGAALSVGDEKVNPVTGEVTRDQVRTWMLLVGSIITQEAGQMARLVKKGGVIVRLVGKANINSFLSNCKLGEEVGILFADTDKLGAKIVNKYLTTHREIDHG